MITLSNVVSCTIIKSYVSVFLLNLCFHLKNKNKKKGEKKTASFFWWTHRSINRCLFKWCFGTTVCHNGPVNKTIRISVKIELTALIGYFRVTDVYKSSHPAFIFLFSYFLFIFIFCSVLLFPDADGGVAPANCCRATSQTRWERHVALTTLRFISPWYPHFLNYIFVDISTLFIATSPMSKIYI